VITEKTAREIWRLAASLREINNCLKNMKNMIGAEMQISFMNSGVVPSKTEKELFSLPSAVVEKLLGEMKAHELALLDQLNTLAVQEAQG